MKNTASVILTLAALLGTPAVALAGQTDNHGIHAVPAPGAVAIDGKLDDWDLSGQVLQCYDLEALRDVYSAQIAMMYDANAFYVAIHWKDPVPMGNCHDPRYQASKAWAGDCVQLRIKTDRICHVDAWYYAAGKEPALHIEYGKSLDDPFGGGDRVLMRADGWKLTDGAEMAFLKDADGRGYVQEIKLPWALITKDKKFGPGEQFSCGIELLWGETDWPLHRYADNLASDATSREFFWTAHRAWGPVFLEAKGNLNLPPPAYMKALEADAPEGPVAVAYEIPRDARVTIAIDDAGGKRVRNLVPALPRKAGKNAEKWDGLDDNGKPVPPGEYTFKGLHHGGIHANWLMSFGSPGNPTWQTPDGKGAFYGDHSAPRAAAAAGNCVALACPMGEAGKHLIGCDLTGQRLWGLADREFGRNRHISLATDGKLFWVANESPAKSFIYRVEAATGKYAPWERMERDANGKEYKLLELSVSETHDGNLTAIAFRNDTLAVCLARENVIKLLDAQKGDVKGELKVEEPKSVAFDADDSLIVLSKGRLLRVPLKGEAKPFAAETFEAGYGVAADAQRNVYLSVRGADQNVKVFSPDGKLVREIGKRGGRPANGPYDENAMRNPGQPAVDSQGRLWIPEETFNPKRTSVWSADGKLVKDFIGTTGYAGAGSINPDDPTMAFSENTVFQIDIDAGTWKPVWSLGSSGDPNDLFPPQADSHTRVLTRDGATYVYSTDSARGANEVHCIVLKDGKWRSAAHTGVVATKKERVDQWAKYKHPFFEGRDGQAYAWADKNGDGLVQPDELAFAPLAADGKSSGIRNYYWGQLPQTDGTIAYLSSTSPGFLLFPIQSFTACGAPVYDIAHPRAVPLNADLFSGGGEGMLMGGSQGRVYLNRSPLSAVDASGKTLGTYPSRHVSVHGSHTAKAARPGYLIGPSMILGTADFGGEIGEVFYLNGNLGENYIFTSDVLWVQALFKDTRGWFETPERAVRGMSFDATTAGGESFGGNFIRAKNGKCYLVNGGTDARIIEITGLDTIKRFSGRFTYTPEQFAAAQKLMEERAAKALAAQTFTIAKAAAAPTIDGKPNDWPALMDENKPALDIREDQHKRYGRVLASYDAANLYVAWRVFAPGRMRNAGQDYRLLFKTGDCVDLMLGSGGGLRLLVSTMGNAPTAVLYEKKADGVAEKDRAPFASPWRTIYFDRVTQPGDVKVAAAPCNSGYLVEAQIPWARLGVKPASGAKLKGDFGILFADAGGSTTIARQYWSNKATGLVNDVPGEADLTPNLWGEFVLE